MSREDLKALGDSLAHLSPSSVRDFYERAYQRCRMSDRDFPTARAIQEHDVRASRYAMAPSRVKVSVRTVVKQWRDELKT